MMQPGHKVPGAALHLELHRWQLEVWLRFCLAEASAWNYIILIYFDCKSRYTFDVFRLSTVWFSRKTHIYFRHELWHRNTHFCNSTGHQITGWMLKKSPFLKCMHFEKLTIYLIFPLISQLIKWIFGKIAILCTLFSEHQDVLSTAGSLDVRVVFGHAPISAILQGLTVNGVGRHLYDRISNVWFPIHFSGKLMMV